MTKDGDSGTSPALDTTFDAGGGGAANPAALGPGVKLEKYELRKLIGSGGMGVVWSAYDPDLDRLVAIKLLLHAEAAPQLRTRLLREARAMARLKHPNVLTVHEVGSMSGRDYIVMELVEGTNLDQFLATNPPHEYLWDALLAAGRGLAAAHEAGLVHRDFKPHNVLRSKDGRVLVTDFGLARGMVDEPVRASAPSWPPAHSPALDETLDASPAPVTPSGETDLASPLTQTGALIGTPAYMAPEVYMGSQPDPRTDQFAYCVTVWQALAGERPFKGGTLDELRRAALHGVTGVKATLPKGIRPILERGLSADPQQRWPNMDALLDALEHAVKRPRKPVWLYPIVAIAVVALAINMFWKRGKPAQVAACEPPEAMFDSAWSPKVRAEIARSVQVTEPAFERVAKAFDGYREKWLVAYKGVCAAPTAKQFHTRVDCLAGLRDDIATLRLVLAKSDQKRFEAMDAYDLLPNVGMCMGAVPIAPPPPPDDPKVREQMLGLMSDAIALQPYPRDDLDERVAKLLEAARTVEWPPMLPRVQVAAAEMYLRTARTDRARELINAALPGISAAHDTRFEAIARMTLLRASLVELEHPGWFGSARTKGKHEELDKLLTYAKSAVHAAGDDPLLVAALLEQQADSAAQHGLSNPAEYDQAIAIAKQARAKFELGGDPRRAALALANEAFLYLRRGDETALDDAFLAARSAEALLENGHYDRSPIIDSLLGDIAFARRNFAEARRRQTRAVQVAKAAPGPARHGRVVDADGRPVGRAEVVAWTGSLDGDPQNLATVTSTLTDLVETADDGTFTIHAEPGVAIIAGKADQRSSPQLIGNGDITLKLGRTTAIAGNVTGRNVQDVIVFARYPIGDAWYRVRAPIERDLTFHLAGLPGAPQAIGLEAQAAFHQRRIVANPNATTLAWPSGQVLDVVVANKTAEVAWAFRGKVAPKTYPEALELAGQSTETASADFRPIGSDFTDEGRDIYSPGDRHALIPGIRDGTVTVCVAYDDGKVKCTAPFEIKVTGRELSGNRFAAGVEAKLVEL